MADYSPPCPPHRYLSEQQQFTPTSASTQGRHWTQVPPPAGPYNQAPPTDPNWYGTPRQDVGRGGHFEESGRGFAEPRPRHDEYGNSSDQSNLRRSEDYLDSGIGGGGYCNNESMSMSQNRVYSGPVMPSGSGKREGEARPGGFTGGMQDQYKPGERQAPSTDSQHYPKQQDQFYGRPVTPQNLAQNQYKLQTQFSDPQPSQTQFSGPQPSQKYFSGPQPSQTQYSDHQPPQTQYSGPQPPQNQYSGPQHPQTQYSDPQPSQKQFSGPQPPQTQYSGPQPPQTQYSGPQPPQTQYSGPQPSQKQFSGPQPSQTQYSGPQHPQNQYSDPQPSQKQFSGPQPSQTQYSGPQHPQNQYSDPQPSQKQFSGPQPSQTQYSGPQHPQTQYSDPQPSQKQFSGPQPPQTQYSDPQPSQKQFSGPQPSQTQYGSEKPQFQFSGAQNSQNQFSSHQPHFIGQRSPQVQYKNWSSPGNNPPGPFGGNRPPGGGTYNHQQSSQKDEHPDQDLYTQTPSQGGGNYYKPSSSPAPPPPSEDMAHLKEEIEHQKEIKARLIKEVGHLDGQKKMLEEEMRVLNEEKKQLTTDVDKLKSEENTVKTRLKQCEQNLDLMSQITERKRLKHEQSVEGTNDTIKEQQERIRHLEISLAERENVIAKKEMEQRTQADILYQRSKELSIKEYDLKVASGDQQQHQSRSSEKERELYLKQLELDERENKIHEREESLNTREQQYYNWEKEQRKTLQNEKERVDANMKKVSEMFDEAHKMKADAFTASTEDLKRSDSSDAGTETPKSEKSSSGIQGNLSRSNTVSEPPAAGATGSSTSSSRDAFTSNRSATFPGYGADQSNQNIDDESFAIYWQMELNKEAYMEDKKFAETLQKEDQAKKKPEMDENKALRLNLGLSPDATEEEVQAFLKTIQ